MNSKADQSLLMRQARVRKIPTGWKLSTVGEVCSIRNDLRKPISLEEREKIKGQYPYYGPTGVLNYINEYRLDGKFALIGEDGDHFLKYRSWSQTQLVEGKANVNNHAHVIESTPICSVEWFRIFFEHRDLTDFLTRQGAGRFKLNKATLQQLPILIPPIHEQKRIAEILAAWDEAIVLTERAIEAKQKRKKALANYLFGESQDWNHLKLGKLADLLTDGTHQSPKSKVGPFKYITSRNVRFGKLDLNEVQYISEEEHKQIYASCPVKHGDVLLTKDGVNAGNAAINTLSEPFSILSSIAVVRGKKDVLYNPFLMQFILSDAGQRLIKSEVSGQAITRLTLRQIESFRIPIPSIEKQKKIAEILAVADQEISLTQEYLSYVKTQKQGLMQKLLIGEWRISVQEAA